MLHLPTKPVFSQRDFSAPAEANLPIYAVVGVWFRGEEHPTLLSANDKIIVFDTPQMARDFAPRLGGGRQTLWSGDDEVYWPLLTKTGINRAVILWNYDPYEAPNGRSESRLHEWKNHIIWVHALANVGQYDQQTGQNLALGEPRQVKSPILAHLYPKSFSMKNGM